MYGDTENIKTDSAHLVDIFDRQGSTFIIDKLADYCKATADKYNLSNTDKAMLNSNLIETLTSALKGL